MANQYAIIDQNNFPALIAHTGTAGTAETVRLVANSSGQLSTTASVSAPGTQTVGGAAASAAAAADKPVWVGGTDSGGTIYGLRVDSGGVLQTSASLALNTGTLTTIAAGTQNTLGTVGVVNNLVKGTITSVEGGTVGLITRVGNIGTIESGTVTTTLALNTGTITTIVAGTQNTLGTVGVLNNGTLAQVTTVSSITNGTVRISVGTITTGSITDLTTLHAGTINSARIDYRPIGSSILSTHSLGTGGGTVVGTIIAPTGAGTNLYLAGISVVVHSGTTDCGIATNVAGTTGAGVFARGFFPPGGGIARDFQPAINMGANGTLAFFMITAGTASFTANYWVAP